MAGGIGVMLTWMAGSSSPGTCRSANWLSSRPGGMKCPSREPSRLAMSSFDPSR